jgi:hypothetical protein
VALGASTDVIQSGVIVKPHPSNTGVVYVGVGSVTASTGYPLAAGDEPLFVPAALATLLSNVVAISDTASQAVGIVLL